MDEKDRLRLCCDALKKRLTDVNEAVKNNEINDHIESAIKNVQNSMRYERLDDKGPKYAKVTRKYPLATK